MQRLMTMILAAVFLCLSVASQAAINVVTTSTDLACIAKQIGGSKVTVTSLMVGTQNPHAVEPRPSQVVRLSRADLFVRIGMDLDMWADSLLETARNSNIRRGARGYVDASENIRKLEVPTGRVDMSMGDIHIYGNPHYWLDPMNGKVIARSILAGLKRVSPGDSEYFDRNYNAVAARIDREVANWSRILAPHKGSRLVTYHKSWIYFFQRFGLTELIAIEPKPGIAPSPAHVRQVIARANSANAKVILMEPFYPRRFPDLIARETGAKVVMVPASVGGARGVDDYFALIDTIVKKVAEGLR